MNKIITLCLLFGLSLWSEGSSRKPNIIFIMADDVSAKEYSIYGGKGINTPNLDRMAREGVAFKTAWAVPQCAPTRAVLHTGQYACHTKWYGNVVHGPDFSKRENILGKLMQRCGYKTAWFEKYHFKEYQPDPTAFGFDEYAVDLFWNGHNGPSQTPGFGSMYRIQWFWHPGIIHNGTGIPTTKNDFGPDIHADLILDFMKRNQDEPFFVYWPTFLPHKDFNNKTWAYTSVPELDENGNKTGGRVPGSLKSTLEYLDHLLGRILKGVEEAGLADDTIVVFTGDNGTAPYGKCKFEDERGPRVPFVVWGPGRVKPRSLSDVLIDFTDIVPTLAELGGEAVPADEGLDGHSFAPYLLGCRFEERETIFCQFYDGRWVRDKRFLRDARGNYYDCGDSRSENLGYQRLTMASNPELFAEVQQRFQKVLSRYPEPDRMDAELKEKWAKYFKNHRPAIFHNNQK